MRVTMEKLPGVESAAVSLNNGRVAIELQSGNTLTLAQIRQSVEENGFTPRQAVINAHADVLADGKELRVRISGTKEIYDVAHADTVQQQLKTRAGQTVAIEGTIRAQEDPAAAPVMEVTRVQPLPRP